MLVGVLVSTLGGFFCSSARLYCFYAGSTRGVPKFIFKRSSGAYNPKVVHNHGHLACPGNDAMTYKGPWSCSYYWEADEKP